MRRSLANRSKPRFLSGWVHRHFNHAVNTRKKMVKTAHSRRPTAVPVLHMVSGQSGIYTPLCQSMSADLSSSYRPPDQCSRGETERKRRRNGQRGVSLEALRCVIHELFCSVTAMLCGSPHCFDAVLDRVANRTGRAGSLASRFGNVFGCFLHYGL
jgi:hypothetical protein